MKNSELKSKITKYVKLEEIHIKGDKNHIHITAIGDIFLNMSNIKKQQTIYKPITKYIIEKKIHAITIDTFTKKEWEKKIKTLNPIIQ